MQDFDEVKEDFEMKEMKRTNQLSLLLQLISLLAVGSSGQILKSDGTDAAWGSDEGKTPEEIQEKKDREEWAEREDELIAQAEKGIISYEGRTSPIPIPKPNDSYRFHGGRLRRSRRSKTVSGKRSVKTKKRKTRARRGRTRRGRKCNCKNKCKCIRNTRKSRKR